VARQGSDRIPREGTRRQKVIFTVAVKKAPIVKIGAFSFTAPSNQLVREV
jgi:hypothetical protein